MSGRIRTVKPEFLEDEVTAGLSDMAARIWLGCLLLADDYGRLRFEPRFLRSQIYWKRIDEIPLDVFGRALAELDPIVTKYTVNGQSYAEFKNWERHQRVSHPGKPRVPAPPRSSGGSPETLVPDLRSPITDHDPDPEPTARADVRVAPDVPEESCTATSTRDSPTPAESTPRAKRPLSLRRLEEGFLAAAFAEGVSAVTGATYAVPDDERRALDDLVDAHCTAQGDARDDWLRATARRFREAVRGREKFHRFGGPRGCLDWLNAGAPSADELAMSADDLRVEHLEARRKAKAAESARRLREQVRDDDAEAMAPEQIAQAAGGLLRALGGGR